VTLDRRTTFCTYDGPSLESIWHAASRNGDHRRRVDLELCFDMMGDHYADPATFGDERAGASAGGRSIGGRCG
jgi:hypothetical protein